jgi:regulator of vacuolar morphogenesis
MQQDDRLTSLTAVIRRQKQLATAIGVELEQQNEILDGVSSPLPRR